MPFLLNIPAIHYHLPDMNMEVKYFIAIALVVAASIVRCQGAPQNDQKLQNEGPTYKPSDPNAINPNPNINNNNNNNYVPHTSYPNADTYPNSGYDGYLVPAGNLQYPHAGEYMTSLVPAAQNALTVGLKIFAKVGLFLIGGVALLVVGGLFTTAVCSLTPLCTITFNGFQTINKESMRSYMSPDNLSQAADFVTDAIGKYQRLQRAVAN